MDERVLRPPENRQIIHDYGESLSAGVQVYPLEEVAAEKLRALLQQAAMFEARGWSRSRARDYYDLWRVLGAYRDQMDLAGFDSLLREKCAVRDTCPGCGGVLDDEGVSVAYVTDIPAIRRPQVRAYRVRVCRCRSCGRQVRGEHPEVAPDQYGGSAHRVGKRLMAAAHVLHYGVGVPVRKVPAVLRALTGAEVSQGAISQDALRRARGAGGEGLPRHRFQGPVPPCEPEAALPRSQADAPPPCRKLLPAQRPAQVQSVQQGALRPGRQERKVRRRCQTEALGRQLTYHRAKRIHPIMLFAFIALKICFW